MSDCLAIWTILLIMLCSIIWACIIFRLSHPFNESQLFHILYRKLMQHTRVWIQGWVFVCLFVYLFDMILPYRKSLHPRPIQDNHKLIRLPFPSAKYSGNLTIYSGQISVLSLQLLRFSEHHWPSFMPSPSIILYYCIAPTLALYVGCTMYTLHIASYTLSCH